MLALRRASWAGLFAIWVALFTVFVWQATENQHTQSAANRGHGGAYGNIDNGSPEERLAVYTLWLERFTGALVIVSFFQFLFLIRADETARRAADAATDAAKAATTSAEASSESVDVLITAESAYIWGGLGDRLGPNKVMLGLNNYGKTPALVTTVFARIRPLEGLPAEPEIGPAYGKETVLNYFLPPTLQMIPAKEIVDQWDGAERCVFYGRVTYVDVFKRTRHSGFILELKDDGAPGLAGFPKYWEWT